MQNRTVAFFLGARGRNATKSDVGRYFDNPSDSIAVQFLASQYVNFLERPKAIQARFGGVSGDDSDPSNGPGTAHASGTSIGAAIFSALLVTAARPRRRPASSPATPNSSPLIQ